MHTEKEENYSLKTLHKKCFRSFFGPYFPKFRLGKYILFSSSTGKHRPNSQQEHLSCSEIITKNTPVVDINIRQEKAFARIMMAKRNHKKS